MSVQAIGWVLENSPATGTDRLVLIALANHFDWQEPSLDRLAIEARCSRSTVQRSLRSLEEAGYIMVVHRRGRGRTNSYAIVMDASLWKTGQDDPFPQNRSSGTEKGVNCDLTKEPVTARSSDTDVVTPSSDSPPARPRQRNPLFDTLARVCDINVDELTPPQAKRIGTALALIRKAREAAGKELRVGDLEARAARYRRKYPQASLTPTALSAHWAELGPGQTPPSDLIPGDVMGGTR